MQDSTFPAVSEFKEWETKWVSCLGHLDSVGVHTVDEPTTGKLRSLAFNHYDVALRKAATALSLNRVLRHRYHTIDVPQRAESEKARYPTRRLAFANSLFVPVATADSEMLRDLPRRAANR